MALTAVRDKHGNARQQAATSSPRLEHLISTAYTRRAGVK